MKRLLLILGLCLALVMPGWAQGVKPKEGNAFSFNKKKFAAIYLPRLLSDRFITPRAAGAVNGTAAEPGPGPVRTIDGTANNFSVVSQELNIVSAGVSSQYLSYPMALTHVPGLMLIQKIKVDNAQSNSFNGFWKNNATGATEVLIAYGTNADNILSILTSAIAWPGLSIGSFTTNTYYTQAIITRTTGSFGLIKGGTEYPNWRLVFIESISNGINLLPSISEFTGTLKCSLFSVPTYYWLPAPLACDGFSLTFGVTDGLGHQEVTGVGAGGAGKVWTTKAGTWQTAAGKASASALAGGLAIATVDAGTANVYGSCDLTRSAGSVGNIWRYIDADNYLFSYTEGTNFILKQRLATVESTLVTGAVTYGAGKTGVVVLDGTAARVYYDNALVGTGTVNAAFANATQHGLYTTNTGNTLDNFCVYARGNEGQYNVLDVFAQ